MAKYKGTVTRLVPPDERTGAPARVFFAVVPEDAEKARQEIDGSKRAHTGEVIVKLPDSKALEGLKVGDVEEFDA